MNHAGLMGEPKENMHGTECLCDGCVQERNVIELATKRADMYEAGDVALFGGYFKVRHFGLTLAEIREARANIARRH